MNKCLIITSHVENLELVDIDPSEYSCIICADGGLLVADSLNLKADLLIGDYDSMTQPEASKVIKLPMEKDMTDSEAALDLAVSKGFKFINILGGLGGRFDHTMGNIGLLAKYCGNLHHLALMDGQNYVFMILPGAITIPKNNHKYLGLISYDKVTENLTLQGVKYPLKNHSLTDDTTLGVSNEITSDAAEITFDRGRLLIILSKDVDKF